MRYWEEIDLVRPSARTGGGLRLYSEADVPRLLVVKSMKPLGRSLEARSELLELLKPGAVIEDLLEGERGRSVEGLRGFAERTDESIEKLEHHLIDARALRARVTERLAPLVAAGHDTADLRR